MAALSEPDKHEEFWFEDGDLVLLVDGVYFKVHRRVLAESCGLIKDLLSLPSVHPSVLVEGTSIEHPIPIHDVAFDDFEVAINSAYCRMPIPVPRRDNAGIIRLVRAAHRLQSQRLLVLAASQAMKQLPAVDRLLLCRELDLDSYRESQEEANQREENRRLTAYNRRAAARGLPTQAQSDSELRSRCEKWLITAVCDITRSSNVTLPCPELDDSTNLRLVLARSALFEQRRKQFGKWAEVYKGSGMSTVELKAASAGLDIYSDATFDGWFKSLTDEGHRCMLLGRETLKEAFMTEFASRVLIRKFWEYPL